MKSECSDLLWVVSSYYNPAGYQRRRENYEAFRRNLSVPLLVIELAEPGAHQLGNDSADQVVQVSGDDRLWQKERLINLAVSSLPPHVEYVAWVDCDVLFDTPDWASTAQELLDKGKSFVQLFEHAAHLPAEFDASTADAKQCRTQQSLFIEKSFGSLAGEQDLYRKRPDRTRIEAEGYVSKQAPVSHGMAWAARRGLLQQIGLYDACVIGGGDTALALAAAGRAESLRERRPMTDQQFQHYLAWAAPFAENSAIDVGHVPGTLFHLWHGGMANRRYAERHKMLCDLGFNPATDLLLHDNGTWSWATHAEGIRTAVSEYFFCRAEDQV